MGDVTSHPLANQAEACLFGRSLNTSLYEIYDHKAAGAPNSAKFRVVADFTKFFKFLRDKNINFLEFLR